MKILYTGGFAPGSLTDLRRKSMVELGHHVTCVDRFDFEQHGPKFFRKFRNHLVWGPGVGAYNRQLVHVAESTKFDLIYVDVANWLYPATVRKLTATGATVASYTSEHFTHHRHVYRRYFKTVPLFDVQVVTFPSAYEIVEGLSAQRIEYTEFGFDPEMHTPIPVEEFAHDIVFIGHWEPTYEHHVKALRDAGLSVAVYGSGWRRAKSLNDRMTIGPVITNEYSKTLRSAKICLGFLTRNGAGNHWSGGRSFEIPAVGRLLLAMRTESHEGYFEEGKQAEYFSSTEEMIRKARHYLENDDEREAIASAGLKRAMSSGYTNRDRVEQLLDKVMPAQ